MRLMVIGFPKSGTTSITDALEQSGLTAAHWAIDDGRFVGKMIYESAAGGGDPLAELSDYDAITQADVCIPAHGLNFWPQLDFDLLRQIREHHPTCWFLLNRRDPVKVCDSIDRWPSLRQRITEADIPGLPAGVGADDDDMIAWIEGHYAACHEHLGSDPYFADIDIESDATPERLGQLLGIPIEGWGIVQPQRPNARDINLLMTAVPVGELRAGPRRKRERR